MGAEPARVMFMFWGRRGSLTKIAHDVHAAALAMDGIEPTLSISRQAANFAECSALGRLHAVNTFDRAAGAITGAWRLPSIGRALRQRIKADRIEAVVNLMPHVWTPFMAPAVRRAGARFATIIHDASAHPGDRTALLNSMFAREARRADVVFTLSEAVRARITGQGGLPAEKVVTLFHPDLDYSGARPAQTTTGGPLRLLFLGRIMRYKGLGLLAEALELLRGQGVRVELGVYGEGSLAPYEARLRALGATIVNRWLDDDEVGAAFAAHDAVVLSHVEASQSGVAAAAFGAGLPVIATPVGGLAEQISDGVNGVLADAVSAAALAAAIARLDADRRLLHDLGRNVRSATSERSMQRFVREIVNAALPGRIAPAA